MNRGFKFGLLAFVPLFFITLVFVLSPGYLSEEIVSKLKPFEYFSFISLAVGLPLYFYKGLKLTVKQMLFSIGSMWGAECVAFDFLAYWFVGLRKDMPYTLSNIIMVFTITFLIGFVAIALVCLIGIVLIKFLKPDQIVMNRENKEYK